MLNSWAFFYAFFIIAYFKIAFFTMPYSIMSFFSKLFSKTHHISEVPPWGIEPWVRPTKWWWSAMENQHGIRKTGSVDGSMPASAIRVRSPSFLNHKALIQKKFYNRETLRGIRISPLAEIPPLFHDWLISLK